MPIIYLRNVTYAWRHHSGRWIKTATLSVEQCGSFLLIMEKIAFVVCYNNELCMKECVE